MIIVLISIKHTPWRGMYVQLLFHYPTKTLFEYYIIQRASSYATFEISLKTVYYERKTFALLDVGDISFILLGDCKLAHLLHYV